jgi:hypothetical protein
LRRVNLPAAVAVTLVVSAASSAASSRTHSTLLALRSTTDSTRLVRLDRTTLERMPGRSLELGSYDGSWTRSPDGFSLAFGTDSPATVRFVSSGHMRVTGVVPLESRAPVPVSFGSCAVDALAWVAPRTVLAAFCGASISAIDSVSNRVRWRKALPSAYNTAVRTRSGFVLLGSPGNDTRGPTIGPASLTTVDRAGHVRTARLDRIESGVEQDPSGASLFSGSWPGLAVDPVGNQAYVAGGDGLIAQVDLGTMAVSYHQPARALAVADKGMTGPVRQATWLGNGLLAVTGEDNRAWLDAKNRLHEVSTPIGLTLVDSRSWTARLVDPGASDVVSANGLLLAYRAPGPEQQTARGMGLSAYGLDGTARFHLLGRNSLVTVQAAKGLAYAWQLKDPKRWHLAPVVIDLGTGQVLARPAVRGDTALLIGA